MQNAIIVIVAIVGYSAIAGAWIAGLNIAAEKYVPGFDAAFNIWPELCGAFWPFAGAAAAAYILVQAYIESKNKDA